MKVQLWKILVVIGISATLFMISSKRADSQEQVVDSQRMIGTGVTEVDVPRYPYRSDGNVPFIPMPDGSFWLWWYMEAWHYEKTSEGGYVVTEKIVLKPPETGHGSSGSQVNLEGTTISVSVLVAAMFLVGLLAIRRARR